MKHKYLEEIVNIENTPYGFSQNTGRDEMWEQQKQEYGFDERETWSMDYTFVCWLYERLSMYDKVNIVNTEAVTIDNNTFQQHIDKLIELCKTMITTRNLNFKEEDQLYDEILTIFNKIIRYLWW